MLEMRFVTPDAKRLVTRVLDGREYRALELSLHSIRLNKRPEGASEIRISGSHRFLIVHLYTSLALSAIFVLGYHLERKGEPTLAQTAKVEGYRKEIQELEAQASLNKYR